MSVHDRPHSHKQTPLTGHDSRTMTTADWTQAADAAVLHIGETLRTILVDTPTTLPADDAVLAVAAGLFHGMVALFSLLDPDQARDAGRIFVNTLPGAIDRMLATIQFDGATS
jgi:hypothetical protein